MTRVEKLFAWSAVLLGLSGASVPALPLWATYALFAAGLAFAVWALAVDTRTKTQTSSDSTEAGR